MSSTTDRLIDRDWLLRNWRAASKNFNLFYICQFAPVFNIHLTMCPRLLEQAAGDSTDLAAKKTLASEKAVQDWNKETDTLLMSLAVDVHRAKDPKLRSLSFTAGLVHHFLDDFSYLKSITVFTLLSTSAPLTTLDLDFLASNLLPEDDGKDYHVCTAIAAKLPTLQVLKLRMRSLCPVALTLPLQYRHGHGFWKMQLRTVVVDLRLPDDAGTKLSAFCAQHDSLGSNKSDKMATVMQKHLQSVLIPSMMQPPRSVRLLWAEPQPGSSREDTDTEMVSKEWAFGQEHRADSGRASTESNITVSDGQFKKSKTLSTQSESQSP